MKTKKIPASTAPNVKKKEPMVVSTKFSPMVSIFANCNTSSNPSELTFADYLQKIKNGYWKEVVDQARIRHKSSSQEYNIYKEKSVPCITAHGTFSRRSDNELKQMNGLACFDWDAKDNPDINLKSIREKLKLNPYVYAIHISLSGEGLAIFCRIETSDFKASYKSLSEYLQREYNIVLDKAATGISRLRIVSFDPEKYLNEKAHIWKNLPTFQIKKKTHTKKVNPFTSLKELHSRHLKDQGNHHGELISFISAARSCGFTIEEVLKHIHDNVDISAESAHSNPNKLLKEIADIYQRYPSNIPSDNTMRIDACSLFVDYLINHNIQRNEITRNFEQDGCILSEQSLNGLLIQLKMDNPKIRGLTVQLWETVLNSSFVPNFNPLQRFLEKNGYQSSTGNISKLIQSLRLKERSSKVERLIYKWLVGMVASIFDGNYNPLMLVLIGPKGCGKTEFFRRLLPVELKEYFAQSKLQDGKDSEALMCEALLILNDELDGLHAREAKSFRAFISADYYYYRPPYAKSNIRRKRLATVCGASNDPHILIDVQNNRRIIPIEITSVDHDLYNSIDKTELFMELYQEYQNGYDCNLTAEEMEELEKISQVHETTTLELELVQQYIFPCEGQGMTASEVLIYLAERTYQKLVLNKIGTALKRCGFVQEHVKIPGTNTTKRIYRVTTNGAEADWVTKGNNNECPF